LTRLKIIQSLSDKASEYLGDPARMKALLSKASFKIKDNNQLSDMFEDIGLVISLTKDYTRNSYRNISKVSMAAIVAGIIYLVNPMDIIPDFLFGGFIDDAAVIGYILTRLREELDRYKSWKNPEA
jgi:uncharacterized membrane protein YkvA (DUF1232 family)